MAEIEDAHEATMFVADWLDSRRQETICSEDLVDLGEALLLAANARVAEAKDRLESLVDRKRR